MKIFPPEAKVDVYNAGFDDLDILDRKKLGISLSRLVDQVDDPLVIALDGKWGVGKSHFLQRWVGAHTIQNEGLATTVYFDAFSQDYLSDPLVSLIAAISSRVPTAAKSKAKKLQEVAYGLVKPATKLGLSVATLGATNALSEVGDVIAEAISSEADNAVERFWRVENDRLEAFRKFGGALEELLAATSQENSQDRDRLVIVIDELDRCRPDYALEILEIIKHFFAVEGLHFVLGVNLEALEQSVKARYGAGIDAEAYLRKFIGLRMQLPAERDTEFGKEQVSEVYFRHLASLMGIPEHLSEVVGAEIRIASRVNHISMRDVGKIASAISLTSATLRERTNWMRGWLDVFATMIVAKTVSPKIYSKFLSASITSDELFRYYGFGPESLIDDPNSESSNYDHQFFWTYWTWIFLSESSLLSGMDKEVLRAISQMFGPTIRRSQQGTIPLKVERDWIDVLSFYGTS